MRRPFRILSLAGGGYLGLYTACVLAELEARAGEPLARRFDLIAGTSVGGILAIGLAIRSKRRAKGSPARASSSARTQAVYRPR